MNLRRTRKLFPEKEIVLITNQKQLLPIGIKTFYYNPGSTWHKIEMSLTHPKNYRNNFWLTSMTRFLAIMEYQSSRDSQILHIESDVIISRDFPFNKFETLDESIGFPVISDERGVASVLYLRDTASSKKLLDTLLSEIEINSFTSDMLILGKLYHRSKTVCALPIGPEGIHKYRDFTASTIQQQWEKGRRHFGGIFDGADVGIYFFGTDPRNARGQSFLQRGIPSEYGNPKEWSLHYSDERNFVDILSDDVEIPLFCLHITSKQLAMFKIRLPKTLIQNRLSHLSNEKRKIYIRVGIIQGVMALKRRTRIFVE